MARLHVVRRVRLCGTSSARRRARSATRRGARDSVTLTRRDARTCEVNHTKLGDHGRILRSTPLPCRCRRVTRDAELAEIERFLAEHGVVRGPVACRAHQYRSHPRRGEPPPEAAAAEGDAVGAGMYANADHPPLRHISTAIRDDRGCRAMRAWRRSTQDSVPKTVPKMSC
jgi:hypothetical protein